MRLRLIAIGLILLCAACSSNQRVSESNPETTAPSSTPTPKPFPSYLLLKVGGMARLGDNGGSDNLKLSIYKTLSGVEAYCGNDVGDESTFNKPAKLLVKIIGFRHISTLQGMSEACNPVINVAALDDSWSGWLPSVVVQPNLPSGVKLILQNAGPNISQNDIFKSADANHGSFKADGGTILKLLKYDDTPGDADYYAQVMSGPDAGKTGWVLSLSVDAENGDTIALYESPETARQGNIPGGPGAYTNLEVTPTPTPGEATIAQRETNRLNDYVANYNKSINSQLYSSASVDAKSATFVVDADVWDAMSGQDQRLVFNNAVHAWGKLYQINHPGETSVELPIQFQDLSGATVKQDIIMIGGQN